MDLLSLSTLLPEITLTLAALLLLMVGVFMGDRVTNAVTQFAVLALLLVAAALGATMWGVEADFHLTGPQGFVDVSLFTSLIKLMVLITAAGALLLATGYLRREEIYKPEYAVLVLLAVTGMCLMLSASNFLMLYMGLEMQSLCLYVLAAFRRDATRATEAGLKYFVLGALASGLLLYGISLVYGFTGSLSFAEVATALSQDSSRGALVGFGFILVALLFKVSVAPFHMWVPDVYEGAPTPVTAFFSVVPKIAAFGLLMKVCYGPFAPLQDKWLWLLPVLAAITMLWGAIAAIGQTNLKRLLAYSSIGHVGFALMGLAANDPRSVIVYLAFYAVMSLGVFAVLLLMHRDERMLETIDDLAGLSRVHPGLAAAMAILMFSMAGIPPLVGFFTKLYVFVAAVQADLIWLAVIGAVASVVGAYYYLNVIKVMYFDEPVAKYDRFTDGNLTGTVTAMAVLSVAGLLLIAPVVMLAQYAVHLLKP